MKKICLMMLIALSPPAFAQAPDESMTTTGSRIPTSSFGLIAANAPVGDDHACAEPNCGRDPEDNFGGGATTQQQKTENNKKAKDKAKQNKDKLAPAMKNDKSTLEKVMAWINGVSVDGGANWWLKIRTKNGTEVEGQGCIQHHAQINVENPESKDYCVQRKLDVELVKKVNGTYENQLNITYEIYDTCYWEKQCGVERITFIAGSLNELKGFLNETIGEKYY